MHMLASLVTLIVALGIDLGVGLLVGAGLIRRYDTRVTPTLILSLGTALAVHPGGLLVGLVGSPSWWVGAQGLTTSRVGSVVGAGTWIPLLVGRSGRNLIARVEALARRGVAIERRLLARVGRGGVNLGRRVVGAVTPLVAAGGRRWSRWRSAAAATRSYADLDGPDAPADGPQAADDTQPRSPDGTESPEPDTASSNATADRPSAAGPGDQAPNQTPLSDLSWAVDPPDAGEETPWTAGTAAADRADDSAGGSAPPSRPAAAVESEAGYPVERLPPCPRCGGVLAQDLITEHRHGIGQPLVYDGFWCTRCELGFQQCPTCDQLHRPTAPCPVAGLHGTGSGTGSTSD